MTSGMIGMTRLAAVSALALGLAACNPNGTKTTEPAPSPTPEITDTGSPIEAQIKARQANFKTIAANVKTIREEIQAGNISSEKTIAAISVIQEFAPQIPGWFPEGTGPESGVKTNALPAIWQNPEEFSKLSVRLEKTMEQMNGFIEEGDLVKAENRFNQIGKACGTCHKQFKLDD